MPKKKNGSHLSEKRRAELEKKKRTTDTVAYILAALAVAAIIAVLILAFVR